jgi:hypothetical protein
MGLKECGDEPRGSRAWTDLQTLDAQRRHVARDGQPRQRLGAPARAATYKSTLRHPQPQADHRQQLGKD